MANINNTQPHHVGELAYLDTFSGLVPCKVIGVTEVVTGWGFSTRVTVKLTATRAAYRKGEIIPEERSAHVVPRSSVRTVCGQYRIRNNYHWAVS